MKICEFSPVFQSYSFVMAWYQIYHSSIEPLLLLSKKGNEIQGIFRVCINSEKTISGAGFQQGEYHFWVSTNEIKTYFFIDSIRWL